MAGNTFGSIFRVTTFGESHGAAIGAVVDGCPAGIPLSSEDFTAAFNTAMPVGSFETTRREPNIPEILSGVFEGKTIGTPITILLRNADARPHDYEALKDIYRPGHADFAYAAKYRCRDWRGGGRASGREAAARVAAGVIAKKVLTRYTACTADGKLLSGTSCTEANRPQREAYFPITIETAAIEIAGIPCEPISAADELINLLRSSRQAILPELFYSARCGMFLPVSESRFLINLKRSLRRLCFPSVVLRVLRSE